MLEYDCGRSRLKKQNRFNGRSARKYFNLYRVNSYEPTRNNDKRAFADAVVYFDVMEPMLLLTFDNAHTTHKPPLKWNHMVDYILLVYLKVSVFLLHHNTHDIFDAATVFSDAVRQALSYFEIRTDTKKSAMPKTFLELQCAHAI